MALPIFCRIWPKKKCKKTANKVIEGENLDLLIGSLPTQNEEKDACKKTILTLLKKLYDIEEEDFLSAELEIVPSGPARDFGLDRSMIAGYGHDDRVCAFTSLKAVLDTPKGKKNNLCRFGRQRRNRFRRRNRCRFGVV